MVVFYTLIDIGALNAFLIWQTKFPNWEARQGTRKRRHFLLEVAKALALPMIKRRTEDVTGIQQSVLVAMEGILGEPVTSRGGKESDLNKRGKCHVCIYEGRDAGYKASKDSANKVRQTC